MPGRRPIPETIARHGELTVERDPRRASGRLLRQHEMDASYVDLADPTHLEFDYLRWMRIVLQSAHARRVLHIGGGGCALARALAVADPAGRQEVCEADHDVLELARRHLGLRRMPGLRVRHAEGRSFLAGQPSGGWDAVAIDAFVGVSVPPPLVTVEGLGEAARVAPLTLVNVIDDRSAREVAAVAAGLAEVYAHVWAIDGRGANAILGGSAQRLDLDRLSAALAADPMPSRLAPPHRVARLIAGAAARRDGEL